MKIFLLAILVITIVTAQPYAVFTNYDNADCTGKSQGHHSSYFYPADGSCFRTVAHDPPHEHYGRNVVHNSTHIIVRTYPSIDCAESPNSTDQTFPIDACHQKTIASLSNTKPQVHWDPPSRWNASREPLRQSVAAQMLNI